MNSSAGDAPSQSGQVCMLPRVVLADQSIAVLDRLEASILDVSRVVGRTTNAHDAIRSVHRGNPQLAVFDIAIANGVDLLRVVKRHIPPVIAVVLTHSAEETTRNYCLRLGAEYFLDKIRDYNQVRQILIAVGNKLAAAPRNRRHSDGLRA